MLDRREGQQPELSIVIPVLNESENIRPLLQKACSDSRRSGAKLRDHLRR